MIIYYLIAIWIVILKPILLVLGITTVSLFLIFFCAWYMVQCTKGNCPPY